MGGLHIEYFMEPFAIYENNSLRLRHLKTFSRIDNEGVKNSKIAKTIREFII